MSALARSRRVLARTARFVLCLAAAGAGAAEDPAQAFRASYDAYRDAVANERWRDAMEHAAEAHQLGVTVFGEAHPNTAALAMNHARMLLENGRREAAIPVLEEALALYTELHGERALELVDPLMARGDAEIRPGDAGRAAHFYDRAIRIAREARGRQAPLVAELSLAAGTRLLNDAQSPAAEAHLERAHRLFAAHLGPGDPRTARAGFVLGRYALAADDVERAERLLSRALDAFRSEGGETAPLTLSTHAFLVAAYERLGRSDDATEHCRAIGRATPPGEDAPETPLYRKVPEFPSIAEGRGYALIEFTVDEAGFVREPRVLESQGGPAFVRAALDAVAEWRYAPRYEDGQPVPTPGRRAKVRFQPADAAPPTGSHLRR